MKFELIGESFGIKIFGRIDEDGKCRFTCIEDDPAYQDWLNTKKENLGGIN